MSRARHIGWVFPPITTLPPGEDLIAAGADLEPETLLAAYQAGYFPMPLNRRKIGWFSPDPRGVFRAGDLRVYKSLRRSLKRYEVTTNTAFEEVITACADPGRPYGWIDRRITDAYIRLHHLGYAHSVEAWDDDGLAGGLYGIRIGGFFAGESMFHRRTDASKVALVHLVEGLGLESDPGRLLDVQWMTPHLASLGCRVIDRPDYWRRLLDGLERPPTDFFQPPSPARSAGRETGPQ